MKILLVFLIFGLICLIRSDYSTVCYSQDFGCFTTEPPFTDPVIRPLSVIPESPEKINATFTLYTRSNPIDGIEIKPTNESKYFKRNSKVRFIIHGFLQNGKKSWINSTKNALLKHENSNVIVVDWSSGNQFPYIQAVANTQIVGASIANLVNKYVANSLLKVDDVHIIGHSLGSHVAGYAGERIVPKISRITGLDPAGLYFEHADPKVRLDKSDAKFVDIIHTDSFSSSAKIKITDITSIGAGLVQSIGNVDFFVNGGKNQPNCPITPLKLASVFTGNLSFKGLFVCDHIAAINYFIDSIENDNCKYSAFPCDNFTEFQAGNCLKCSSKGCNQMGFHASPLNDLGDLYLSTHSGSSSPFCHFPYEIALYSVNSFNKFQTSGKFSVVLNGSLNKSDSFIIDNYATTFREGLIIKRLIESIHSLGSILSVIVSFTRPLCITISCWKEANMWRFEKISLVDGITQKINTFCTNSTTDFIFTGSSLEYFPCNNKTNINLTFY